MEALFFGALLGIMLGLGFAALWYGLALIFGLLPPSQDQVQGICIVAPILTMIAVGALLLIAD